MVIIVIMSYTCVLCHWTFFIDWLLKIEIRERERERMEGYVCGMRENENKRWREEKKAFLHTVRVQMKTNERVIESILCLLQPSIFLFMLNVYSPFSCFFFLEESFSFYKFHEIEKKTFNLLLLMICAWKEIKKWEFSRIYFYFWLMLEMIFIFYLFFFSSQAMYILT